MCGCQLPHNPRLQFVGILILVDHDIAIALAHPLPDLLMLFEKRDQVHEEIVIVHDIVRSFVRDVGAGQTLDFFDLLGKLRIILRNNEVQRCERIHRSAVHALQRLFLRKAFVLCGESQPGAEQIDHILGIPLIENCKIRCIAHFPGILPQVQVCKGVEGAAGYPFRAFIEQQRSTAQHFPGRFSRERQQQNHFRMHPRLNQTSHAIGQRARLACPRPCHHQHRTIYMRRSLVLRLIEFLTIADTIARLIRSDEGEGRFSESDFFHEGPKRSMKSCTTGSCEARNSAGVPV